MPRLGGEKVGGCAGCAARDGRGAPDRRAAGGAFVQTGREAGEVRPAERRVTEGHLIEEDGRAGHPSEELAEQPGCGCASAAKRAPAAKRAGRAIVVRCPPPIAARRSVE